MADNFKKEIHGYRGKGKTCPCCRETPKKKSSRRIARARLKEHDREEMCPQVEDKDWMSLPVGTHLIDVDVIPNRRAILLQQASSEDRPRWSVRYLDDSMDGKYNGIVEAVNPSHFRW